MPVVSRRSACGGIIAGLLSGPAMARLNSFSCAAGLPWNTTVFPVKIDDFEDLVNDGKIDEQETPELCWAASIHAILVYHGSEVTQDEVYQRVKGKVGPGSGTGTIRDIIKGLSRGSSGWYLNTGDSRALVIDLQNGNPVLIGLRAGGAEVGHVIVAYGATYVMFPNGQTFVDEVDLWDPARGEGLKTVSGCDIKEQLVFALHSWHPG